MGDWKSRRPAIVRVRRRWIALQSEFQVVCLLEVEGCAPVPEAEHIEIHLGLSPLSPHGRSTYVRRTLASNRGSVPPDGSAWLEKHELGRRTALLRIHCAACRSSMRGGPCGEPKIEPVCAGELEDVGPVVPEQTGTVGELLWTVERRGEIRLESASVGEPLVVSPSTGEHVRRQEAQMLASRLLEGQDQGVVRAVGSRCEGKTSSARVSEHELKLSSTTSSITQWMARCIPRTPTRNCRPRPRSYPRVNSSRLWPRRSLLGWGTSLAATEKS